MHRVAGGSRLVLALSVVAATSLGGCGKGAAGAAGLDAALAAAGADGKAVMAEFTATWCEPCRRLEATTFADARVRKWLDEHVHVVRLDLDQQPALAAEFGVTSVPTMVFLRSDRSELGTITGYRGIDDFLAEAERRLAGVSDLDEAQQAVAAAPKKAACRREYFTALCRAGRNDEALEQAEQYWQLSRRSMFEAGVRASFFLAEMEQLASDYEPARAVMRRWLAEAYDLLLEKSGKSSQAASELGALALRLDDVDTVLAVAKELSGSSGARSVLLVAGELLVRHGHSEVYVAAGAASKQTVAQRLKLARGTAGMMAAAESSPAGVAAVQLGSVVLVPFEALARLGRVDEAMELAELVLPDDVDDVILRLLKDAARRAGRADLEVRLSRR